MCGLFCLLFSLLIPHALFAQAVTVSTALGYVGVGKVTGAKAWVDGLAPGGTFLWMLPPATRDQEDAICSRLLVDPDAEATNSRYSWFSSTWQDTVFLEGIRPGLKPGRESLYVSYTAPDGTISTAVTTFTTVQVDLGLSGVVEADEESVGGFVSRCGGQDQDRWTTLTARVAPDLTTGTCQFTLVDSNPSNQQSICVWAYDKGRWNEILGSMRTFTTTIGSSTLMKVQGVYPSRSRGVEIRMSYYACSPSQVSEKYLVASDSVRITVPITVGSSRCDYGSVQGAIDHAFDGAEIVVNPGLYRERISLLDRPNRAELTHLTIRSLYPMRAETVSSTVLDGGGIGPVVVFEGDETEDCLLRGFTIQNGRSAPYSSGGGVVGNGTKAEIRGNRIQCNEARVHGGALFRCDGEIRENLIQSNYAGHNGGGLAECNGLLYKNQIVENEAYRGGGLSACNGTISGCLISANEAWFGGAGMVFCSALIENCIVTLNSAHFGGGGLGECDGGGIYNCTIAGNTAGWLGGGLYGCDTTIANCIVWGNRAPIDSQLSISSSLYYSCIEGGNDSPGNISSDPKILDLYAASGKEMNWHLSHTSACIDSGTSIPLMMDADSNLRPADDVRRNTGGSAFDMGADETPSNLVIDDSPYYDMSGSGFLETLGGSGEYLLMYARCFVHGLSESDRWLKSPNGGQSWQPAVSASPSSPHFWQGAGGGKTSRGTLVRWFLDRDTTYLGAPPQPGGYPFEWDGFYAKYVDARYARSTNNGATWKCSDFPDKPISPADRSISFVPFGRMVEMPGGRLLQIGMGTSSTKKSIIRCLFSDDDGWHWGLKRGDVVDIALSGLDNPSLVGEPYGLYIDGSTSSSSRILVVARYETKGFVQFRSLDGGATWAPATEKDRFLTVGEVGWPYSTTPFLLDLGGEGGERGIALLWGDRWGSDEAETSAGGKRIKLKAKIVRPEEALNDPRVWDRAKTHVLYVGERERDEGDFGSPIAMRRGAPYNDVLVAFYDQNSTLGGPRRNATDIIQVLWTPPGPAQW